jgi:hypothetical protein
MDERRPSEIGESVLLVNTTVGMIAEVVDQEAVDSRRILPYVNWLVKLPPTKLHRLSGIPADKGLRPAHVSWLCRLPEQDLEIISGIKPTNKRSRRAA